MDRKALAMGAATVTARKLAEDNVALKAENQKLREALKLLLVEFDKVNSWAQSWQALSPGDISDLKAAAERARALATQEPEPTQGSGCRQQEDSDADQG